MHFVILLFYKSSKIITKLRMDVDMNDHILNLFLFILVSLLCKRMADNIRSRSLKST